MYFNQYSSPMGLGNIGNYPTYSMPNFQTQNQNIQQAPTQNMEWIPVNGIEGAKNHIVSRNETAWLMDNNECKFYVKIADNLGVTTLKAYKFTEITPETNENVMSDTIDMTKYVTKTELAEILKEITEKGGKVNE